MSAAGELDQRIRIMRQSLTPDAMGGAAVTWEELGMFWAKVIPMSGRERDHAAQTVSPRNYRITLRKSSRSDSIRADDRLTWRGLVMLIRFIAYDGNRPQYLNIEAEEQKQYAEGVI
jgi:SPP1 family predicted phage head-tail adaptor